MITKYRFICWGYDFANVKKLYVMDIDDSIFIHLQLLNQLK